MSFRSNKRIKFTLVQEAENKETIRTIRYIKGQLGRLLQEKNFKGVLHKYNEITQSAPAEVSNDAQLLSFFVYASFQDSEECNYKKGLDIFDRILNKVDHKKIKECKKLSKQWESSFSSVIRLASLRLKDPLRAYNYFSMMAKLNITPLLRSLSPVIIAFANQNEVERCKLLVNELKDKYNILITEREVLPICASFCRLNKNSEALNFLKENFSLIGDIYGIITDKECLILLREIFTHLRFSFSSCQISEDGQCSSCKDHLLSIDLSNEQVKIFKEAIYKIATGSEEKKVRFDEFVNWLDGTAPFDIFIDGANVAMYNQNFETSKFSFYQIEKVIDSIEKNFGGKRVLVIIHEGRLKPHLINREDLQILNKLKANKSLYVAPYGSNDDWYWMFAALNSLHTSPFDGKVVTNDHMRDHHFQLLHPFYFRLWRERHVVRFDFERGQLFFYPPSKFSKRSQFNNNNWHFAFDAEVSLHVGLGCLFTCAAAFNEGEKVIENAANEFLNATNNFAFSGKTEWFCAKCL